MASSEASAPATFTADSLDAWASLVDEGAASSSHSSAHGRRRESDRRAMQREYENCSSKGSLDRRLASWPRLQEIIPLLAVHACLSPFGGNVGRAGHVIQG